MTRDEMLTEIAVKSREDVARINTAVNRIPDGLKDALGLRMTAGPVLPQVASWLERIADAASRQELTFRDALTLAKGCRDYGGGWRTDAQAEIYLHGIQTVVNVLESVLSKGFDSQTAAVFAVGKEGES